MVSNHVTSLFFTNQKEVQIEAEGVFLFPLKANK